MHHVFISLMMTQDDKKALGLAVIRTNEKGTVLKSYAEQVTTGKDFEKICDTVYKEVVHNFEEHYVVITDGQETHDYFKENKITLFESPWLNMTQLSWPLVFSGLIPGRSLVQIANHFGLVNEASGTATGNCEFLARTYWHMMRSMRLALVAEEGMRDYGGKIIANVRSIIGI